jgi:hypothetical protein
MSIEWKEPPPSKRGRPWSFTPEFYEELKANPNQWALFREATHAAHAYKLRNRYPDLEVTLRGVGTNEGKTRLYDIYVRYVGYPA